MKLFTIALLALSQSAFAQIVNLPGAGGQFQQIPPSPVQQRAVPEIRIEQGKTPAIPPSDNIKFLAKSLRVTGQTLYSEAELVAITGFNPGGELTLFELRGMASRIADHYHRNGYFVAQAYLPAQDIKDGAVTIAVLEGRYGSVTLRNQTNLSNSLANGLLAGLNSGDIIAIGPLEHRLLLLSDLPGVIVRSTLVPGAAVGTSDLLVDVTPGRRVTGSVEADNGGSRYTGEYRVGGSVNINNPLGLGDVAGLRVLTSGHGLTYGRAFYQAQAGKATLGVAYTALEYRLGKEFAPLQAHGTAEIASIYGSYPLIRSRNTNLYALIGYDDRTYQDKVDTAPSPLNVVDKKAHVWMGSLYGNHRDRLGAGGVSSFSLTYSAGDLDIRTPWKLADDAATARTNGNYGKLAFYAARLQNITDTFSLYGAINGQVASKNLDISEKMGLGGPYAVRAYPVGEAYGDEGYVINLEARLRLPKFSESLPGQFHLIGFVDAGSVTINKNPWAAGDNRRTLSATGVGLTWS
ncbi:MAG: ShlB/FhaC/HecB family hemolysin secretion/activation protein, partial [Pseudomonadota bacterium]